MLMRMTTMKMTTTKTEEDESDDDKDIVEDDDKNESSDEEDEAIGWTFQRRNCWFCLQSSPVSEKKAKLISPVESLKKGDACKREGHSATPRPAKQGDKMPANNGKE